MTDQPLSPTAQAIRYAAICAGPELEGRIAAVLRAAADQVEQKWRGFSHEACQEIRAIAAELEDYES